MASPSRSDLENFNDLSPRSQGIVRRFAPLIQGGRNAFISQQGQETDDVFGARLPIAQPVNTLRLHPFSSEQQPGVFGASGPPRLPSALSRPSTIPAAVASVDHLPAFVNRLLPQQVDRATTPNLGSTRDWTTLISQSGPTPSQTVTVPHHSRITYPSVASSSMQAPPATQTDNSLQAHSYLDVRAADADRRAAARRHAPMNTQRRPRPRGSTSSLLGLGPTSQRTRESGPTHVDIVVILHPTAWERAAVMRLIRDRVVEDGDGAPFPERAIGTHLILDFFGPNFFERADELNHSLHFTGVPVQATLQDLVHQATALFCQPPLSATFPNHNPLVVLHPRNRGIVYWSHGMPERRRWSTVSIGSCAQTSVSDAFLNHSRFNCHGAASGPNPNSHYFHLAPREDHVRSAVPVATVQPLLPDHLCGGIRLLHGIALDDYNLLDVSGGFDAFRSPSLCGLAPCPPWEANPVGTVCETHPATPPSTEADVPDLQHPLEQLVHSTPPASALLSLPPTPVSVPLRTNHDHQTARVWDNPYNAPPAPGIRSHITIHRLLNDYVETMRRRQPPINLRASDVQDAATLVEGCIRQSFRIRHSALDIASGFDIELTGGAHGDGILRGVITCLADRLFSGPSSVLQPGHNDRVYWEPRVLAHILPNSRQQEDAFYEGVILMLQIIFCHAFPIGMAIHSLILHLTESVESFTRRAAETWTPTLVSAIDAHRNGEILEFGRFCLNYLNTPVRTTNNLTLAQRQELEAPLIKAVLRNHTGPSPMGEESMFRRGLQLWMGDSPSLLVSLLHQFDGGIVSAFLDLQDQEIASFASISSQVHFGEEPEILTTAFQRQEIPGYAFRPTCLKDALVAFLEGCGIPDAEAGAEIGLNQLAEDLHEDLDKYGSRVRLFYLAITASRSRVLSSVSVSYDVAPQLQSAPWRWGTCYGGLRIPISPILHILSNTESDSIRLCLENYFLVQILVAAGSGAGGMV